MIAIYLNLVETQQNKSKFQDIYESYSKLMKFVALEILNNDALAEDAVQEAFYRIIEIMNKDGIKKVDCNKTKRLVCVITKNISLNILAKEKREQNISFEICCNTNSTFDKVFANELEQYILQMPQIYRDVLELTIYYGMSVKQISKALKITEATVRKRLQRARQLITEHLED